MKNWILTIIVAVIGVGYVNGQEVPKFICGTDHSVPDVVPPVIAYQEVPVKAGVTSWVGVLFYYAPEIDPGQAAARAASWVYHGNRIFAANDTGLQVFLAGVRKYPSAYAAGGALRGNDVAKRMVGLNWYFDSERRRWGGDLVTLMLPSGYPQEWSGTAANIWTSDQGAYSAGEQAYSAVKMRWDATKAERQHEALVFVHEIGHLLGLWHDRATLREQKARIATVEAWAIAPDAFGHQQGGLGTVMSYVPSELYIRGFSSPSARARTTAGRLAPHQGQVGKTNAARVLRGQAFAARDFAPSPPSWTSYEYHTPAHQASFTVRYMKDGQWQEARQLAAEGDSAFFYYPDVGAGDAQVFAKLLKACSLDGSFWAYASGLTDRPLQLALWDTAGKGAGVVLIPPGETLERKGLRFCR